MPPLARWMLLLTMVVASASCDRDVRTAAEVRDACRKDPTSKCCAPADCANGEICDFSIVCG